MGLFSRVPAGAKAVKPRLYQAIDRATSEYLSAPNLAQNMDVVSTINSAQDPAYASNKACKRLALRLRTRNQRVQFVALQLLENCMRSCGETFHKELAASDLFNNDLSRMGDRSVWCATDIQRLVLALIQEWAYEIKIPAYSTLYNKLQQRGMPFPPRGAAGDAAFQPYPGLSPTSPGSPGGGPPGTPSAAQGAQAFSALHPHAHRPRVDAAPAGGGPGAINAPPRASSRTGAGNLGPDLLHPSRTPAQLQSDLEVGRGTVGLLNEVLDGAEAEGNWGAVKEEYCAEVVAACSALKDRVAALLGAGITDEGVVAAAIEVNDDAQRALDRRMALMEIADGRRAPPPGRPVAAATANGSAAAAVAAAAAPTAAAVASTAPTSAADAAPSAAAPAAPVGNLMDLLDLDWTPAPEPGAAAGKDPFLPPPPMVPPPMNNPFAAGPGAGEAAAPAPAPPVTAERLSPTAAAAAAAAPAPAESNPFLNDDAFAQLSLERDASGAGAAAAAAVAAVDAAPPAPAPVAASGNPFATATTGIDSAPPAASASFGRPLPLAIPAADPAAAGFTPGPFTAPPAYGGFPGTSTTAAAPPPSAFPGGYAAPLPTAGAVPSGYHTYEAFPPPQAGGYPHPHSAAGAPSPYLSAPPAGSFGAPPPGAYSAQQIYGSVPAGSPRPGPAPDSFQDLVQLRPKRAEPPPPPKGAPMRAGSTSSSMTSVSGAGAGAPPSANGGGTPTSAPPPPQPQPAGNTAAAGLSAFDAFDALASGR